MMMLPDGNMNMTKAEWETYKASLAERWAKGERDFCRLTEALPSVLTEDLGSVVWGLQFRGITTGWDAFVKQEDGPFPKRWAKRMDNGSDGIMWFYSDVMEGSCTHWRPQGTKKWYPFRCVEVDG